MFIAALAFNLSTSTTIHKSRLTDEEVVRKIVLSQNPAMVEILYERYVHKVYRKSLSFVKDPAIAEDLTHDIFIKVYMNLASFKEKSKFSTWLYSITYNFCIDYLRKSQKSKFVSLEDERKVVQDMEVELVDDLQHIKAHQLKKLLEQVKGDEKMILTMKYQDDMSIRDIQQVFKISESAVKMRIKRAKEKVRKLYHEKYAPINI